MLNNRIKKLSPRTPPEIWIHNFWLNKNFRKWIFTVSLTGSGPEMTIRDRMGDSFGVWRSRLSFRFHGTMYQFPVQGTLAKNCQSATQLLGGKKTTQLLIGLDGVRTGPMKPSISRAWAPRWSGSVIILFNSSLKSSQWFWIPPEDAPHFMCLGNWRKQGICYTKNNADGLKLY